MIINVAGMASEYEGMIVTILSPPEIRETRFGRQVCHYVDPQHRNPEHGTVELLAMKMNLLPIDGHEGLGTWEQIERLTGFNPIKESA